MSRTIPRRTALAGLLATGLAPTLATAAPKKKRQVVLVGGTLLRPGESPLKDAVVHVEDDTIRSVGTDRGAAPKGEGVVEIDARKKTITYGFTDPLTQIGLIEVSLEKRSRDTHHLIDDPVRAAFRAADGYNPASSLVKIARLEGITSVGVIPSGGLVTGQSAWADLAGRLPDDALGSRSLALHVAMKEGKRGTSMLRLRELFEDARAFDKNKGAYDGRRMRKLGASRLDLAVVARALKGDLPVVVHVQRASDIVGVLALAKKNGLELVLAGAAEGWKVADVIAKAGVGAIVNPLLHGPRSFAALGAREDNAALLHKAGVKLALTTSESHNARKLRQVAGNAVRAGLPHAAAIEAVTRGPAELLGMGKQYGSPKTGQIANLVVWSADPFEISSRAAHVLIRGRAVTLRSRQTALYERYR